MAIGVQAADVAADCRSMVAVLEGAEDERQRTWAAAALGHAPEEADCAVPALVRALQRDDSYLVRDAVLRSLGDLGEKATRAIDDLFTWTLTGPDDINDDDVENAIRRMGGAAVPRVIPYLRMHGETADEDDLQTWGLASRILRGIGGPAVPLLIEALDDREMRYGAVIALGMGPVAAPAVSRLVRLYRSLDRRALLRGAIVVTLTSIGEEACDARPVFCELASDPSLSAWEKRRAVEMLRKLDACAPAK